MRRLCEANSTTGRVDKAARIIHGVVVLKRHSANGRTYSDQAMQDVADLLESVKCFDSHAQIRTRKTSDVVGRFSGGRVQGDSVRGDLHVSARASWLLEDASNDAALWCLSIDADGDVDYKPGGNPDYVKRVTKLRSVDLQSGACATTSGLFESTDNEGGCGECVVEKLLRESKLPPPAITDYFLERLSEMKTTEEIEAAISERWELISEVGARRPGPSNDPDAAKRDFEVNVLGRPSEQARADFQKSMKGW